MPYYIPVFDGYLTTIETERTLTEARALAIRHMEKKDRDGNTVPNVVRIFGSGMTYAGFVGNMGTTYYWQPAGTRANRDPDYVAINKNGAPRKRS